MWCESDLKAVAVGLDLPPDVEHLCDPPASVQPRTGRHQQALQPEGHSQGMSGDI